MTKENLPTRCPNCNSARIFRLRIDSDWTSVGEYDPINSAEHYPVEDVGLDGSDKPDIDVFHCRDCDNLW